MQNLIFHLLDNVDCRQGVKLLLLNGSYEKYENLYINQNIIYIVDRVYSNGSISAFMWSFCGNVS